MTPERARAMNEWSFSRACLPPPAPSPAAPSASRARPRAATSATRILAAATRVFARHGFFGAQVADVARAGRRRRRHGLPVLPQQGRPARLDLREDHGRGDRRRTRGAGHAVATPRTRLRRIARLHLGRLGADRDLAVVFQVELRQSTKFMERFSATRLRDYLGIIRDVVTDGQAQGRFRREHSATLAAKMLFGALDEMATNWVLSGAQYSLASDADAVVDLFVRWARARPRCAGLHCHDACLPSRYRRPVALAVPSWCRHDGRADRRALRQRRRAGAAARPRRADAAREGLERARRLKPDPFFTPDALALIRTGGFDADLDAHRRRRLDPRGGRRASRRQARRCSRRVDAVRRPGSIVSSNTSGIPIAALAEGRCDDFRRHWLGTHFFNPPRYLRLLEVIPTPTPTRPSSSAVTAFADHRLGKGVVVAKDTPNFIANHIGALRRDADPATRWPTAATPIEEIDAITGPALGRPKSATFRTMDIAGLDVLGAWSSQPVRPVARRRSRRVRGAAVSGAADRAGLGRREGRAGLLQARKNAAGESEILTLGSGDARVPAEAAREARRARGRASRSRTSASACRTLFAGKDRVGAFLRRRWRRRSSTPHGSRPTSRTRSTTSTA